MFRFCLTGFLLLAMLALPGCAGTPSIREASEVSIRLYDESEYQLIMRGGRKPNTDFNAATGAMGGAAAGFADCATAIGEPFTALLVGSFCAAGGAVLGGAAGAIVSGVDSLDEVDPPPGSPDKRAPTIEVRQAWHDKLEDALSDHARDRGKNVVDYPYGDTLHVVAGEFLWDVKSTDEIAMVTTVLVAVGENGKFARKQFNLSGPYLSLDEWTASGGARVVDEVDAFAGRIADEVWDVVE